VRVVVTGAGGRLGRAVVGRLREQGIAVVAVDKVTPQGLGARALTVDLCDLGHVYSALAGAEAVIHLGAIPAPVGFPPEVVYGNNILSQFNVFEAAATLGIRRVVSASSVSALGFPWQHRWSEPLYVPIDEKHPLLPQDAYGLSKANGEEIAAAYCRRGAGSAASLRFATILEVTGYHQFITGVRADPGAYAHLLWSYVDLRDAAEACVLALTTPFEGHHACFITAGDTASELPTDELLDRYYPRVPRRSGRRRARWSLLEGTQAAAVLGYHGRYTWQAVLANTPEQDEAREAGPPKAV
jgi:nucleoside-diphosphate-sugar epimerase